MKQLVFMVGATFVGTIGALYIEPFLGIAVYYLFAILRPQSMWSWSLPTGIRWSYYVALATIVSVVLYHLGPRKPKLGPEPDRSRAFHLTRSHWWVLAFGIWIGLSYLNAFNRLYARTVIEEYSKIFIMFAVAAFYISRVRQLRTLLVLGAVGLGYIAYEMNYNYFFAGRLDIYHNGYGGLDNNGAALMLAMGIPLCLFLWEGIRSKWRWMFVAFIPILLHAVLMSYSRGAMLSLVVVLPLVFYRSRRKKTLLAGLVLIALAMPILAGEEIRARFFSIQDHEVDASANSRKDSWAAALKIAVEHPVLGVGPRNANLLSLRYGADQAGRTIHSQYFQLAADIGFVGLGLYLGAIGAFLLALRRVRKTIREKELPDGELIHMIASAAECSFAVFMVGAFFLSLEVFELPYLLLLIGLQLDGVVRHQVKLAAEQPAEEPELATQSV